MNTSAWDAALKRHMDFWRSPFSGEGSYIALECPAETTEQPPASDSLEERWLSPDFISRSMEYRLVSSRFYLDAYPSQFINTGAGVMAAWFGADTKISKDTIWFGQFHPPISNWERDSITLNPQEGMYRATYEMTRHLCEHSHGRYAVSVCDLGGTLDILSSLRGAQPLLMDLLDHPEEVKRACETIDRCWIEEFHRLTALIEAYSPWHTSWIAIQNQSTWYPLQCDFCTMLSPQMFEEFVLPSLLRQAGAMEQSVYHLDGPEEIKHLDRILTIPNLHAVQWVALPQANETGKMIPDYRDDMSIDVYRRILRAGKKVIVLGVPIWQVEELFDRVGSEDGFFISTFASNEEEARQYLPVFQRHCRNR